MAVALVNAAIAQSGLLSGLLMQVRRAGGDLTNPWHLFVASSALSARRIAS